jgi:hypothetical protein
MDDAVARLRAFIAGLDVESLAVLFIRRDDGVHLFPLVDERPDAIVFDADDSHLYVFLCLIEAMKANPRIRSFRLSVRFAWMFDEDFTRAIVAHAQDESRMPRLVGISISPDELRPGIPAGPVLLGLFEKNSSITDVHLTAEAIPEICRDGLATSLGAPAERTLTVYNAGTIPLSQIAKFVSATGISKLHIQSETDFQVEDWLDVPSLPMLERLTVVSMTQDSSRGGFYPLARFIGACPGLDYLRLAYYHGNIRETLFIIEQIPRLKKLTELEIIFKVPSDQWSDRVADSLMKAPALECLTIGMPMGTGPVSALHAMVRAHPRLENVWMTERTTELPIQPDRMFVFDLATCHPAQKAICQEEIQEKKRLRGRIAAAAGFGLGDLEREFAEFID